MLNFTFKINWIKQSLTVFALLYCLTTLGSPVTPSPTPSSNSPVCQGANIQLFATTVVGATYSWTGPNGYTSTSQNPVIFGASAVKAGTYNVIATVGGIPSSPASIVVAVTSTPSTPVVNNNGPVCVGDTLTLTASTVSGATYSWSGPNGYSATGQTVKISSAQAGDAGNYSAVAVVTGCNSASSSTPVTIKALPIIAPTATKTSICIGDSTVISVTGGLSYSWTGSDGSSTIDSIFTIKPTTNVKFVVGGNSGNSCSAKDSITITVNSYPAKPVISNNSPICENALLTLHCDTVLGATYTWTGPNGFNQGIQDPTITNVALADSGDFSAIVTVNGCSSLATLTKVIVKPLPVLTALTSNSPLCSRSTIQLQVDSLPAVTYNWTGPNSFTSSSFAPVKTNSTIADTGVYSVTATLNGCLSNTLSTNVKVKISPSAPTLNNNSPICSGQTFNLSCSTIPGGTYAWTGPATYTSIVQNPEVKNSALTDSGSYSVVVTIPNGCTSPTTSTFVKIKPTPAIPSVITNAPICQGTDLTLSASLITGVTYSWTGPHSFTDTLQNPIILKAMPTDSGTYSVTTSLGGCTSAPKEISILVNPNPVPYIYSSKGFTFCQGDNITLKADGGASYKWSNGSTANSITVTGSNSYSVSLTDFNGCSGKSDTIQTTVVALPPVPTITQIGYELKSSSVDGNQWYSPTAGKLSGAIYQTYKPTADGDYTVVVSNANFCTARSAVFKYKKPENPSGINSESNDAFGINIYPNPAITSAIINYRLINSAQVSVELYSLIGEKSYLILNSKQSDGPHTISLPVLELGLSEGIYFLRIKIDEQTFIKRLVLTK